MEVITTLHVADLYYQVSLLFSIFLEQCDADAPSWHKFNCSIVVEI
jgi:hypothetical protein